MATFRMRLCFFCLAASWLQGCVRAAAPAALDAKASKLVSDLDSALHEDAARKLVEPYLTNLKDLHSDVVEKIVSRQWWTLAQDIVQKSHVQQVDFSIAVRKAVRALKDEADELLRTLNPKYGEAQLVNPAFQWAQNDTSIFLTVKYTVRWNAPGALEVTEPSVNMSWNWFNFTGLGKHSNNKYRYLLSLGLFDTISSQHSSWSAASVGKMTVTLRKKWPRKWPRLLANKKAKIGNMHVWMEMQEKLDSTLSGMSSVSHSPITCRESDKLYCGASDSCKKADNCTQCTGKEIPKLEESICTGLPSAEASLTFADNDLHKGKIGGDVKVFKAKTEYDIDFYRLYFGKDHRTKWEDEQGKPRILGQVEPTGIAGQEAILKLPMSTELPSGATHILVYSVNEFGEHDHPGNAAIRDATLPKGKPEGIAFVDEDEDKGEVQGTITVTKASNEEDLTMYAIYWGKSATRKATTSVLSELSTASFPDKQQVTYHLNKDTKPPEGASHLLVFSKNEFGELPQPVSIKVVDNVKPCLNATDSDCVKSIVATSDGNAEANKVETKITITPAADTKAVTSYKVYWGKRGCESDNDKSAKNGHLRDIDVNGPLEFTLTSGTFVPNDTTHVLVFSANKIGESDHCVAASFEDDRSATAAAEPQKAEL